MTLPIMPVDGKLPCAGCKQWLPVVDFHKNKARPCGRFSYCKPCQKRRVEIWRAANSEQYQSGQAKWRERNADYAKAYMRRHDLMRKYGLTEADYDAMLDRQDARCAVCRTDDPGNGRYTRFLVDHDHATGQVRALLCNPCNVALGQVQDDPDRLHALSAYLLSFRDVLAG